MELFGDTVESIKEIDPLRGKVLGELEKMSIFPSSHYVTSNERRKSAVLAIREELQERLTQLRVPRSCSRRSGSSSGRCSTSR